MDTPNLGQAYPGIPTAWKLGEQGTHSLLVIKVLAYVSRGDHGERNI